MPFKKKINSLLEMQKAEIERLQLSNESLNEIIGDLLDDWSSAIEKAKIKAINEFAERLKEMPSVMNCEYEWLHTDIDNLIKEMTEVSE